MTKEDFHKLLDKYLSGNASHEEEQQLLNFYGSFNQASEKNDLLENEQLANRIFNQVKEEINPHKFSFSSFYGSYIRPVSIAAMILMVVSFGLYLYSSRSVSQAEPQNEQFAEINSQNDISPGNNKAILTLADGTVISLDDAQSGLLASQGNIAITKTNNGEIVYEKNHTDKIRNVTFRSVINTIQTPKGGKYQVRLPDGSKVWLNSASSLSYPTAFIGRERIVKLKGEAYFEITPNKSSPFRVESDNQIVEVLGTNFNVNSYEDEDFTKTTLIEGSVKIILNPQSKSLSKTKLLKPGEQSSINSSISDIKIENVDTEKAIAWKNGYFKFKNTPIQEIMREVERWYDVELIYEGNMPTDEFTGFISNDVKISAVLKILEQSGGVKFTVKGKKLKVKSTQ